MSQIPNPFKMNYSQAYEGERSNPAVVRFFNSVYSWMCVGLALTALVAWFVSQNAAKFYSVGMAGLIGIFVVQMVLVVAISSAITRISAGVATALFLLYSALTGVMLSVLFLVVAKPVLTSAFVITAGTFGAMSVYGMVTKRDLTSMGRILMMALIGLIIATVVTIFVHSTMMQVVINYVGVLVFVGLTAYDTQKLKELAYQTQDNPALAARLSIVGSLTLYLDFINIFIYIVRIMSDNDRR